MAPDKKDKKNVPVPRPSASIVLLSPTNQILLLHRVQTSSSFASAHVFPGGNLSAFHGENVPDDALAQHQDSNAYRLAAIRETFEESGILLARSAAAGGETLLSVPDEVREAGRKEVHGNKVRFSDWLENVGVVADTNSLIPCTRWVTPANVPKRFTTQMYIYMLPLASSTPGAPAQETVIPAPTHDGGLEHTAASFDTPAAWLTKCREGSILLYPPQLFLVSLIADFVTGERAPSADPTAHYRAEREALFDFLRHTPTARPGADASKPAHPTAEIPWADKVISPTVLFVRSQDQRVVLGLDKPGPELKGSGRGGDFDRVVLVRFSKGGPFEVERRWRDEVWAEQRAAEQAEQEEAEAADTPKL